jgi:hypothetical protein
MTFHQFFDSSTQKKCVTINLNGEFDTGKVLHLESEWTLHEFLNAASNRLGVASLKRIFSSDGVDIDDCMMIEDNDILFISNGDDFIPLVNTENVEMEGGSSGVETINGTISGFRIGKMLGRGGFGEVRIGEHHLTGELVALKFLRKAEIISMGAAERTTTEIQCLSALRHQHIIRLQQVTPLQIPSRPRPSLLLVSSLSQSPSCLQHSLPSVLFFKELFAVMVINVLIKLMTVRLT